LDALKGPNNLAQGIALGWPVPKQALALKGLNNPRAGYRQSLSKHGW